MRRIDDFMNGKRIFDLVLVSAMLLPALAVCAVCVIMIWIDSRANPVFSQIRIGRYERPFTLYKLRTMSPETPQGTSHEIGSSTILRSGRLLRKFKLDELPQLWNIIRGEMSFIGPRPGLPKDQKLIEARRGRGVFALLPGITGTAQVAGLDMSTPEDLAIHDALYLVPWSLARDISIFSSTVTGRGYRDASLPGRRETPF